MAEITVHNLEQSRSFRILWLLEELGVKYEVKQYKRNDEGIEGLLKIHPLGKSPVITTQGGEVIAETGLIFEFLLEKYDKKHQLAPLFGSKERYAIQYWLHYSEGSIMSAAVVFYYLRKARADTSGAKEQLQQHLKFVEGEVLKHEWLAGNNFTAADIVIEFPVEFTSAIPELDFSKYPKLNAWKGRIKERAAYQKALKANGDYNVAGLF